MPKIDIAQVPVRASSIYPKPYDRVVVGREKQALGNAVGLSQFGVNLTRLKPGAASAMRHWHQHEDELIYMIEGELVLIEDGGETVLRPGDAAAFKAGVPDGHCLVNRTTKDAVYLEIGTRAGFDRVTYPDDDLVLERDPNGPRFARRNGDAL